MWIRISLLIASAACLSGHQVTAGLVNGANIRFTTAAEPPSRSVELDENAGGVRVAEGNVVNRFFYLKDRAAGYDLEVEPLGGGQFRLTFKALSATGEKMPPLVALPSYPPPQILKEGETLAVDVMTNPKTGQKIVDRIQVSSKPFALETLADQPRDFQFDDVYINLTKPVVYVNGQKVGEWAGAMAGSVVWVSPPGHGRILLTLKPHEGYDFRKAGVIRGDRVTLRSGVDEIEIRTAGRVLERGPWNVYAFEDVTGGRPSGCDVCFGASDRFGYAQPRR